MSYNIFLLIGGLLIGVEEGFGKTGDGFPNALSLQNSQRVKHHVPPLTLDPKLTGFAQNRAEIVAKSGKLSRDDKNPYGENLAYFPMKISPDDAATRSVQMWYDEVKDYNFEDPGFDRTTGHFTQVVWKESSKVGFGIGVSSTGETYVVAVYDPPGNVGYDKDYFKSVLKI